MMTDKFLEIFDSGYEVKDFNSIEEYEKFKLESWSRYNRAVKFNDEPLWTVRPKQSEDLVDDLNAPIHRDVGRSRPARSARSVKSRKNSNGQG